MSKLSPARKLALDVLMEADRRGMYARDVLSSRASAKAIDQRDSYKETIGNRIDSRQGKGKHRRDYISKKFSSDVHFNPRPP